MIHEFRNVLLDEIPGFPPKRDIELTVEPVTGRVPMSKTPYRVITPENIELKIQLQELWERKYNRPSVFPWVELVGLRKRKKIHSDYVLI